MEKAFIMTNFTPADMPVNKPKSAPKADKPKKKAAQKGSETLSAQDEASNKDEE